MSGIEAAIQVCAALPSSKVLLISGAMAAADLLAAARVQNDEFEVLAKPIHPNDQISKMRNAMGAA